MDTQDQNRERGLEEKQAGNQYRCLRENRLLGGIQFVTINSARQGVSRHFEVLTRRLSGTVGLCRVGLFTSSPLCQDETSPGTAVSATETS